MTRAIVNTHGVDNIGIYYDAAAGCYYESDIDRYVGIYCDGRKDPRRDGGLTTANW